MDKKGKSMDDHFKDSMQSGANPFLNAASLLGGEYSYFFATFSFFRENSFSFFFFFHSFHFQRIGEIIVETTFHLFNFMVWE
jgi:hypothetical protein